MPAAVTLAGADVLVARVDLPLHGAGTIEATIAASSAPSGRVTLECAGGLALVGTIVPGRATAFRDAVGVELVLGAGGLRAHVAGSWRNGLVRDVLNAIAGASGEALSTDIAGDVLGLALERWHCAGTARACLDALAVEIARQQVAETHWRVLPSGALWIGSETWPAASLPAHAALLDVDVRSQAFEIGAETPTITPGVKLDGVGAVWHVAHEITASGVRSRVETTDPGAVADFARAVRAVLGLRGPRGSAPADTRELWRFGLWEATVVSAASDGASVDVRFDDERMRPAQGVRLAAPFPGGVTVANGNARVIVVWLGGSARDAWAIPLWTSGGASKIVIPASMVVAGAEAGAQFVALANLVDNRFTALANVFSSWTPVPNDGGGALKTALSTLTGTGWPASVAASQMKAK